MASPLKLDSYDVVICGGGTAGCVLANRLSEDPNIKVLMLEAGENANQDPRISTPGLFPLIYDDPQRDWKYRSQPSPGLNDRRIHQTRGKCIGGSSAINLMALIYPSKASIDSWNSLGNPGWSWDDLSPYYRKVLRRYPPPEEVRSALGLKRLDDKLWNPNGRIASSYPPTVDPALKAWMDTWKKLGIEWAGYPLEGGLSAGGYISTAAVDPEKGERSHAGVEYFAPASERENLHVVTGAMIDKVELDSSAPDSVIAKGVTFICEGRKYTVKASKEVILSAGVYGSSTILERSGIGSKGLQDKLGIKNIIDNPHVGENLQDHMMGYISSEAADGIPTADMMRDPAVVEQVTKLYQESRSGPLAGGGGYAFANAPLLEFITPLPKAELQSLLDKYLPADSGEPEFKAQKLQYAFVRSILESSDESSGSHCMGSFQCTLEAETVQEMFAPSNPGNWISMLPALAHPFSRGNVHIASTDSAVDPIISLNYGGNQLDIEILARHMMIAEKLAATPPLSDILKPGGRRLPEGLDALTLDNAKDLVRKTASSNYHPCGTCAMMSEELGGVVDERLRVYGVRGLRVVDASVFPIIPRGNIMTTVYAVAEKGSDILKEDLSKTAR